MGKSVYFPGGNDNASGVAMVLDLANYFSKPANQPDFTIVFALFTGEEVGLLGSFYMANNPPFNLSQVKMMLNLDMVGTGSTGFVVVNARKFQSQFDELDSINQSNNYVKEVKARGESCNSDHCPFYIKGVPAFFIYTTGDEYKEYHTTTDLPQRVPLTNYNGVFKILRTYLEEI
jgi:Zn-dependent M28 family amino/carboxypeptidase